MDSETDAASASETLTAHEIARNIIEKYECKLLKKYISELSLPEEDGKQTLSLAAELLNPDADDKALNDYRSERLEMIAAPVEDCLRRIGRVIPEGALNFLCAEYLRELRAVAAAAAELIAEEKHGDLCCLIANEYIERRKRCLGSKLIAVHLVIDKDSMRLYNGKGQEITDEYSAYVPYEDRRRYSRSDLVLSAMVDIAPRSIYVYGGESNLRMLRRIQLMFTGVMLEEGTFRSESDMSSYE